MAQNPPIPYQYIWRDYSQPDYQSLILTLNSYQALSLLAFISAFIAYTQTKWWIITRNLLIRILWRNRLDDSDDPRSIHHLSQAKAIKSLIFGENRRDNHSTLSTPLCFGVASLFNILLFIILGAIIPYYLAGGSGPAKVLSAFTDACNGFEPYSASAMRQAESFYTHCRLNDFADTATCGYLTRVIDSRPQLNFTVNDLCPFEEENCLSFQPYPKSTNLIDERYDLYIRPPHYNKAIKVAYLDMRPSDFGLNVDSRIRQSHSLTCAPLEVNWFQVPLYDGSKNDMIAVWVGYSRGNINESERHASIGKTTCFVHANNNAIHYDGRPNLEIANLYELTIYQNYYLVGSVCENYHPGLKINDGDMFIVKFRFGDDYLNSGTPYYNPRWAPLFTTKRENWDIHALGCFEQYQLCFDEKCMGWSNAAEATREMSHFLQSNYDGDIASEVLRVYRLLIEATSPRIFVARHDRSKMLIRSILRDFQKKHDTFKDQEESQWRREVQFWLEMSFLTAKFTLLASVQGTQNRTDASSGILNNTNWICDKLLFLDNNPTNINFIGLMATLSGLLAVCLFSAIGKILTSVKRGLGICQETYRFIAAKANSVFQAIPGAVRLLTEFVLGIVRRSSVDQSRYSEYDDEEIWNSPPLDLENLGGIN
jgi:hypothetical protein